MTRGSIIFSALETSRTSPIGGVQTWMDTMERALTEMGFDVTLWSPHELIPSRTFDYHVMAHRTGNCIRSYKCIGISHGIIPEERPVKGVPYIATSEEVRDHWRLNGPILRQPIDLDIWETWDWRCPQKLVHFDYRSGCDLATRVADDFGLEYERISGKMQDGCHLALRDASVVLATGRAALEAAAMGIPVLIYANSPFYGRRVDPSYESAMRLNYSARGGYEPDIDQLTASIAAAAVVGDWREHVVKNHDHRKIAAQLVEILES